MLDILFLEVAKNASTSFWLSFISCGSGCSCVISFVIKSPVANSIASFRRANALFWSYSNVIVHIINDICVSNYAANL